MQQKIHKSDKWIPWYFVAFFVTLFVLDGIFVTIATSTHRGVVTENAYKKGLAYNQVITAFEQQEKLGWKGNITFSQPLLSFSLKDKNSTPIDHINVTAYATHATHAGLNFTIPLIHENTGMYKQKLTFPQQGPWDIRVVAQWKQKHYQKKQRIIVK